MYLKSLIPTTPTVDAQQVLAKSFEGSSSKV